VFERDKRGEGCLAGTRVAVQQDEVVIYSRVVSRYFITDAVQNEHNESLVLYHKSLSVRKDMQETDDRDCRLQWQVWQSKVIWLKWSGLDCPP
jgi:hypothetical protein